MLNQNITKFQKNSSKTPRNPKKETKKHAIIIITG